MTATPPTTWTRRYGLCSNAENCTREGALKKNGTMTAHKETKWGRPCDGSGQLPARVFGDPR